MLSLHPYNTLQIPSRVHGPHGAGCAAKQRDSYPLWLGAAIPLTPAPPMCIGGNEIALRLTRVHVPHVVKRWITVVVRRFCRSLTSRRRGLPHVKARPLELCCQRHGSLAVSAHLSHVGSPYFLVTMP